MAIDVIETLEFKGLRSLDSSGFHFRLLSLVTEDGSMRRELINISFSATPLAAASHRIKFEARVEL